MSHTLLAVVSLQPFAIYSGAPQSVFVLVSLLHVWLPWWGASLVVLALFVIAAGILARFGLARMKRVENPAEIVRRRMDSHLDWWQHGLLAQPKTVDVEPGTVESLGRDLP